MRVSITSDSMAILDAPFDISIDIEAIGELESDLEVRVDDMVVHTGHITHSMRIPIKHSFSTAGSHTIRAELFAPDAISQNNIFYRSVHVVPRPRILLV